MAISVRVENIKCGGCANGITQKLNAIEGVLTTAVDVEAGLVEFELKPEADVAALTEQIKSKLASMGYPEVGSVEGLQAAGAKAKSYISCAVGKMTDSSAKEDK